MNTKLSEWRKFKRWIKRVEKKGIVIRRGWGEENIRMYRECQGLFDSPYIKTCLDYWKDVFCNSTYLFLLQQKDMLLGLLRFVLVSDNKPYDKRSVFCQVWNEYGK